MANEATITSSLVLKKGNVEYRSAPSSFKSDVTLEAGPSPGKITATIAGVDVDLTEVTSLGGLCRIQNQDTVTSSVNFLQVGMWDGVSFYPMLELLQGETYIYRIARNLGQEFGTGTGTTGSPINTLRLKTFNASIAVLVEIFNK